MSAAVTSLLHARIERFVKMRTALLAWRKKLKRQYDFELVFRRDARAKPETIDRLDEIDDHLDDCDSNLDSAIVDYSQACLRPVGRGMRRLPRELREMVYEHLLERVDTYSFRLVLDTSFRFVLGDLESEWEQTKDADGVVFPWLEAPLSGVICQDRPFHYEDSVFLGDDFVRELTQVYFRLSTFVYVQPTPSELSFSPLEMFLAHIPFDIGMKICNYIQKLELGPLEQAWGGCDALYRKFIVYNKTTRPGERLRELETEIQMIRDRLFDLQTALSIITSQCAIRFKFTIHSESDKGLIEWRALCGALLFTVEMLESFGCNVSFLVHLQYRGYIGSAGEIPSCDKIWAMEATPGSFHKDLIKILQEYRIGVNDREKSLIQAFSQNFVDRPAPSDDALLL